MRFEKKCIFKNSGNSGENFLQNPDDLLHMKGIDL